MAGRPRRLRPERLVSFDPAILCPLTTDAALAPGRGPGAGCRGDRRPGRAPDLCRVGRRGRRIRGGLAGLGVQRGEHVGVCLGNGPRWVALFLALGSMGAVTVPVNTRLRADEIGYALRQSRVRTLVMADRLLRVDFVAMLRSLCPEIDQRSARRRCPIWHGWSWSATTCRRRRSGGTPCWPRRGAG